MAMSTRDLVPKKKGYHRKYPQRGDSNYPLLGSIKDCTLMEWRNPGTLTVT